MICLDVYMWIQYRCLCQGRFHGALGGAKWQEEMGEKSIAWHRRHGSKWRECTQTNRSKHGWRDARNRWKHFNLCGEFPLYFCGWRGKLWTSTDLTFCGGHWGRGMMQVLCQSLWGSLSFVGLSRPLISKPGGELYGLEAPNSANSFGCESNFYIGSYIWFLFPADRQLASRGLWFANSSGKVVSNAFPFNF